MKEIEAIAHLREYLAFRLNETTKGKHIKPIIASKFNWKNLFKTGYPMMIAIEIRIKG